MITVMGLTSPDKENREELIKSILARGGIVCFRNKLTGVTKHVREWNPDQDGDLTAFYSSGSTEFVCWDATEYEVTELKL